MSDDDWDVEVEESGAGVQKLSLGDDGQDSAVAEAQAAVTANPGSADAHAALGNAQLVAGDDEAAAASFREAVKLDASAQNQFLLGSALKAGDKDDEARAAFEAAVAADPKHAGALAALGSMELGKGAASAALDFFRKAADSGAQNFAALRQAGQLLLLRGAEEAKEAAGYLSRAADADPSDGNVRASLIQAYETIGDRAGRDAARAKMHADAAAGKLNEAFVSINRVLVGQFEAGSDKLVQAVEHFKGDHKFTFNVFKKGEVHDTKILQTITSSESDYDAAKAAATAQL